MCGKHEYKTCKVLQTDAADNRQLVVKLVSSLNMYIQNKCYINKSVLKVIADPTANIFSKSCLHH